MSNATFGHSQAELERKLTVYWNLVEERDAIETRIAAARREKDSVNERIFQRVMSDYEAALEANAAKLDPLKVEIDQLRRQVDLEIGELDAAIQNIEDEIDELRFRQRVGEFDPGHLDERLRPLEPKVDEAKERREVLRAQLKLMDRRKSVPAEAPAPQERPVVATEMPAEAPAPPPDAEPAPLENMRHWMDELEPVETGEPAHVPEASIGAGSHTTKVWGDWDSDPDPLAALSDPAPARASGEAQPAPVGPTAAVAPAAYPSLVIRSGVHAGKIVPLLPMTMSIGREHDNNVELKDPEVARYHARVLYADGRYMVEDLESSTGTWVNGERQTRVVLNDGDVVRIGATELVFELS